ncbi:hypothetical protein BSFA1_36380 [Burkholderia sp. SFA1]|uniref:hypothetical protein n=1 Tax=unclassified Caballeronia TaxID=2646786 RepID=UPI001F2F32DA|nr:MULTISPECIES: hypothetical protein [unclassified Caballeronia]MCE4544424.1 hypothetical protein [Caballeronia sp. PC1]MCE4571576.1 hypothetical protein [Caballeronia sp. CLC5]BBP98509.1 hypothetical protein BSFA1_36380 [Burkholderia sp. SFA1]
MSPHWEIGTASEGFEPIAPHALASVARIDPYIVWANATQYRDLGGMPHGRIPVAIEMKQGGGTARQFAQEIERRGWQSWIWMSALYRDPPPALEATRFCTAHVTREFYARLGTDLAGKFERFTEALAIISHADGPVDRVPASHAATHAAAGNAIVGICDEDVTFTHRRFSEDGTGTRTRFLCFWNQNDAADTAATLGYGSELLKHQMDALLGDVRLSVEAAQAAGGARVYAFADGDDASRPVDHDAPLPMVGVQLKKRCRSMRDAFGPCLDAEVLDAVRYIVQRAREIGGAACHALVSVSAGNAAWQQDGSSLIESALDELMDTGACSVVLPSGNADMSRCRGALTIAQRAVAELRWPVRAYASSPSLAEIWFASNDGAPSIDVQIVPPGGIASAWLTLGDIATYTRGGEAICTVVHLGRGARGNGHMILIALAPTSARSGLRRAAAGEWLVRLRNNARSGVTAYTWMQCDESSGDTPLVAPTR